MHISKSVTFLKSTGGLLLLLTAFCSFQLIRQISDNKWLAFACTLLIVANPMILRYANSLMSEMLFLTIYMATLLSFIRWDVEKSFYKMPWFYTTVIFLAIGYYTRTIAIATLGGIVLSLLFIKRWKEALAVVVGFFLLILPWQIRSSKLGGSSHFKQMQMVNPLRPDLGTLENLGAWTDRIVLNFKRYYALEIPTLIYPKLPSVNYDTLSGGYWFFGTVIVALSICGIISLKKAKYLFLGIIGATLSIMLIYPEVWTGNRLIFHLIPVLVFLIISAILDLVLRFSSFSKDKARIVVPVLSIGAIFAFIPALKEMKILADRGAYSAAMKNFQLASEWVRDNASRDAYVVNRKPSIAYFFSGGKYSTIFPNTLDKVEMLKDFDEKGITHVIVDALGYSSTSTYLIPAINSETDKFKKVLELEDPKTYVFEYHSGYGYKGEYVNGERNGKGTYKWQNGTTYEGEWSGNKRNGHGIFIDPTGKKYEGQFKDDIVEGYGVYTSPKGDVLYKGNWINGKPKR